MSFLHPGLFIAALACVAIPIIIHLLLRRRRKPIAWGAMRFLLEAYQKQRSKLRLQQLILLATRCLIILLIGGAIAGPILAQAGVLGGGSGRDVYLLIDNSVASSLHADGGDESGERTLDRHKATAEAVIDALGPGDRAGVIALGRPASPIVVPASSDLGAVREVVREMTATDSRADIPGALRALNADQNDGADTDEIQRRAAVIISEFRAGAGDLNEPLPSGELDLYASAPASASAANTQVTGIDPLRAVVLTGTGGFARGEQVRVTLRRMGPGVDASQVDELTVSYVGLDGRRLGRQSRTEVRWQPGETEKTVTASVDASVTGDSRDGGSGSDGRAGGAIVASTGRDALLPDNTYRRPLAVLEALRVGVVARPRFERGLRADEFGPPEWISLALRPDPSTPVDVVDIEPTTIDTPTLASVDALMLPAPDVIPEGRWSSIRRFADEGGLVVVFPSKRAGVQLWSDAFTSAMGLPWTIDREPTDFDGAPNAISEETTNTTLIGPVASELGELLAPVTVSRTLGVTAGAGDGDVVFRLESGAPWLLATQPGAGEGSDSRVASSRGLVVYVASSMDLTWTDLPARPLMVPLFQEIVRQGFGTSSGTRVSVAGAPVLAPARAEVILDAGEETPEFNAPVGPTGLVSEPIRDAGLYEARDASGRTRGLIAMNADADGARTGTVTREALANWLNGAMEGPDASVRWLENDAPGAAMRRAATGSTIAWPLLVAGLVLALLETVMARYFSHAFRDSTHTTSGEGAMA